jgi:hypothetical protein
MKRFNLIYATNASLLILALSFAKAARGDFDSAGGIIIVFGPIAFLLGGCIGLGRCTKFGSKSRIYAISLGVISLLSILGNAVIRSGIQNFENHAEHGDLTGPISTPIITEDYENGRESEPAEKATNETTSVRDFTPEMHLAYGLLHLEPGSNSFAIENGIEKDVNKSVYHLSRAAEEGYVLAQAQLGKMYLQGIGVEQDFSEAVKWLELAVENDDLEAMAYLGRCYMQGKGVLQDYTKAEKLFTPPAEAGNVYAQRMLALLYDKQGECIKSAYWFRSAGSRGDATSQMMMAIICNSQGDKIDAYAWALHASSNGKTKMKENLEKELTHQEIVRGQQRAKTLLP